MKTAPPPSCAACSPLGTGDPSHKCPIHWCLVASSVARSWARALRSTTQFRHVVIHRFFRRATFTCVARVRVQTLIVNNVGSDFVTTKTCEADYCVGSGTHALHYVECHEVRVKSGAETDRDQLFFLTEGVPVSTVSARRRR